MAKQKALLLVGASGGVGMALLDYISSRTSLVCLPTYYKNKPPKGRFSWIPYNSNDHESTRSMLEEVSSQYDLTLIIDASGKFFASKIQKTTSQEINQVIVTNLVAPIVLAKCAQEFLVPEGKIVFMSSIVSSMELVGSSAYAASKAGLERAVLTLSSEYNQTGHGICGIRLGYMDYGMTYKINDKIRENILENLPEEKFIDIGLLGEKILEIEKMETSKMNGNLYEII